jgi:cellulose synthase/poly-beta-1,6-N-acetylglucosamine synthase-like glycosyltransferase/cytochrome b561
MDQRAEQRAEQGRSKSGVRVHTGQWLFAAVVLLWLAGLAGLWTLPGLARWSVGVFYIVYDTWLIVYVALALKDYQAAATRPQASLGGPRVAVLISARNEAAALPATLDALLQQDDPADEVWVIDDGSDDDTAEMLARRYGVPIGPGGLTHSTLHPSLSVVLKTNSGKADSLNRGVGLTASDLVITLDADTILRADAVGEMRRAFAAAPRLVAAGGVLTPRCGPGISGRLFEWFQTFEYLRSFIARVAWTRAEALLLVSGAFACYRRDALRRVGGFDTHSWVEDYELIHRLHRHGHEHGLGWKVGVLPGAAAITDAPGTLKAFMRQRRRWFGGFLQTLFHYRDMIGDPVYGRVGRLMLPLKVIDTVQPVFGITAFILLIDFAARRQSVLTPVLIVIGVKLAIDFVFLLWALSFYNGWMRQRSTPREWLLAGLAALTEPFCFQLMRHTGALLGWFAVLTQRVDWVPERARLDAESKISGTSEPSGSPGSAGPRYTRTAMFLHWAVAAGLAVNIALAWSVDYLPDAVVRPVIDTHKSIGITVLGLVLLRILWRLSHAPPPRAVRHPAWERRTARVVHALLYGVMLALPLSGWLHDSAWKDAATHPMALFGLVPWPRISAITGLDPVLKESLHTTFGQAHTFFADVLYGLFALHVLGALKHQLFDREAELQRMLPLWRARRAAESGKSAKPIKSI